jgi:type IX secretion system PorP/SprF family membrane protein
MRKFLLSVSLLCSISFVNAQQLHFMSQYLQHNSMYNPAAAGMSEKNMVGVSYRSMWSTFPGNPKTTMIYGDFELKKLNAGIASYLYRDETGPTSRTGVQLAYSYHIKARNNKSRFGIGLELRGLQYAVDKTKLPTDDPAMTGAQNKFAIDAGAGVYWTNDKFSAGAAVSQLIESKLALSDIPNRSQNGKLYRHYNLTASYKIQTGENIYIIPNALLRLIENSPSEFDLGMKVDYQEKVWWSLNWRVKQFWSIQAGLKLFQRVRATYSYDYYTSPISIFTDGSGAHEIGIQYDFKK